MDFNHDYDRYHFTEYHKSILQLRTDCNRRRYCWSSGKPDCALCSDDPADWEPVEWVTYDVGGHRFTLVKWDTVVLIRMNGFLFNSQCPSTGLQLSIREVLRHSPENFRFKRITVISIAHTQGHLTILHRLSPRKLILVHFTDLWRILSQVMPAGSGNWTWIRQRSYVRGSNQIFSVDVET